jgi:hypothetical protein
MRKLLKQIFESQLETFNGTSVQIEDGIGGDNGAYLSTANNAKHLNPDQNLVRQQFQGLVNFYFNDAIPSGSATKDFLNGLSSLVKTAEFPSFEIQTDTHNQYNKKRITVSGVEYKPISITVYDTIDSAWVITLMRMYQHMFLNPMNKFETQADGTSIPKILPYDVVPEKLTTGSATADTMSGFTQIWNENSNGLNIRPGAERNFLTHIDLLVYHAQRYVRYTMFNPIVTSFKVDSLDYSSSQPITIQMEISYESFSIDPNINSFIPEDDMKRWGNFSQGIWERLRTSAGTDDDLGKDIPGGSVAGKTTAENKHLINYSTGFLAPSETGKETASLRAEQNQDFWNKFNPG